MSRELQVERAGTNRGRQVWVDGAIVPEADARIPLSSPTCQYGLNAFEVVRGYVGHDRRMVRLFRLDDHIERLRFSAKVLRLGTEVRPEEVVAGCTEAIRANGDREDMTLRVTLFVNGPGSWSYRGPCSMMVAASPRGRVEGYDTGVSACVSSWERIHERAMSPRVKTGANYINSRMAQLEAREGGFDMAIFLNRDGTVSESVGSCLFAVRRGRLITPHTTASILESITRDTVIRIAEDDLGIRVEERAVGRTELYAMDEMFLCGTTAEIVPITSVDRIVLGAGATGELTQRVRDAYFAIVRGSVAGHEAWTRNVVGLPG